MAVILPTPTESDELISIPLSALEHVAYCERQAALIHLEATWSDSADTVRGHLAHSAVDLPGIHQRRNTTIVRALPVCSRRYGLHGICDLVEITGMQAIPVEYKVGSYLPDGPARLQLAGQAACLAEAGYKVTVGYIYSAADRRRYKILISDELTGQMSAAADRMRVVLSEEQLPAARNDRRCRKCSLRDDCLPELTWTQHSSVDLFTPRPPGTWRD